MRRATPRKRTYRSGVSTMDALIVYGSLIDKLELVQGGFSLDSTRPVVVRGFKRIFAQEPSWRSDQGEERAVLNVVCSQEHWLNAVLVFGLDDGIWTELEEREKGYNRVRVAPRSLREKYGSYSTAPTLQNIYVYVGKTDKQSDSVLPNSSYLHKCLEGAKR